MPDLFEMVRGGWTAKVWPNSDYTRFTATFNAPGEVALIGHGKSPQKAVKSALKGLGQPWTQSH